MQRPDRARAQPGAAWLILCTGASRCLGWGCVEFAPLLFWTGRTTRRKDRIMKAMNFLNYRNTLIALAVFTALHVEAQTWSNVTKGDTSYVTIQGGQNYALKTNQLVTIVGVGNGANGGSPSITGSFPNGVSVIMPQGNVFTGLTNINVSVDGFSQNDLGYCATLEIKTLPCYNPNTLPVIPQGGSALLQVQSTYNLASGQWTTIYSQAFTNTTGSNQFFAITLSAAP